MYNGDTKPAAQVIGGWEKRVSSPVIVEPELPPAIHYHQVNLSVSDSSAAKVE